MDLLVEFILEFVLEIGVEASENKKVPKPIRYFLIAFITTFFLAVIGLIYFISIISIKENIAAAIAFFVLGTFMLVASIVKLKKAYISKKEENKNDNN